MRSRGYQFSYTQASAHTHAATHAIASKHTYTQIMYTILILLNFAPCIKDTCVA